MRKIVNIFKNSKVVASCSYSIKDEIGYINNLFTKKEYRNKKFGSTVLQKTEKILKEKHNVKIINLLVWQPQSENTSDFFIKNNYIFSDKFKKSDYYDNGLYIIELIPMKKIIKY